MDRRHRVVGATVWLKQIAVLAGLLLLVVDQFATAGRDVTHLGFGLILAGGLYPVARE